MTVNVCVWKGREHGQSFHEDGEKRKDGEQTSCMCGRKCLCVRM